MVFSRILIKSSLLTLIIFFDVMLGRYLFVLRYIRIYYVLQKYEIVFPGSQLVFRPRKFNENAFKFTHFSCFGQIWKLSHKHPPRVPFFREVRRRQVKFCCILFETTYHITSKFLKAVFHTFYLVHSCKRPKL